MSTPQDYIGTEIAIVGMAARLPGAPNIEAYWQNLRAGKEAIRFFTGDELRAAGVDPALLDDPDYVPAHGWLEGFDRFDADFFGFSPRDAAIMDPQHRLFLQCAWHAFEHAGYDPARVEGAVGVFGGSGMNTYMMRNLISNPELMRTLGYLHVRHTGNDKDFLTTRVSYELDLKGPSVNVQTACSTSLVAVHMAAQSLISGECDMALAGGVTIELEQRHGYLYQPGEVSSPDGHCRAFDENSEGTVFGSGVGAVMLKRYEDAVQAGDTIHAVLRGSAVNNDGKQKVGYMAPSVDGQAAAIAEALSISGVAPESVGYIEAHGTGTPVGDPIELAALKQAYGTRPAGAPRTAIGSVKSNIGHLDTAAGVAALIKAVQAIKHREIPPSLHFESPNPKLGIEGSPFYVAAERADWPAAEAPRRAAVSSLGVGGTNAHVVLEEAPAEATPSETESRPEQVLVLSAKTEAALGAAATSLADHLESAPEQALPDVAHTLQAGRAGFAQRRAVVARTHAEAAVKLRQPASPRAAAEAASVAFMFAGGGAQYPGMGAELYEREPAYRAALDECLSALWQHENLDLESLIFPDDDAAEAAARALERPSRALPALFATQYAQAKLWMAWGVEPSAMIGHSMGEYTAACLAGVMSVKDAARAVALRGRLFETLPEGSMLSVPLSEDEVRPLLGEACSVAAVNGPALCVVSGPTAGIEALEARLLGDDIEGRRLRISAAGHSPMVEPILKEFRRFMEQVDLRAPERPFVSTRTGTWITTAEATDPDYWTRHIRDTVRFADGLGVLLEDAGRALLEVGPGRTLASLAQIHPARDAAQLAANSMRHPQEEASDVGYMLGALGQLWCAGAEIDWAALRGDAQRRRVPLPGYPFEQKRYWIDAGKQIFAEVDEPGAGSEKNALERAGDLDDWFYRPTWTRAPLEGGEAPTAQGGWLIFCDEGGAGDALARRLGARGEAVTTVVAGDAFRTQSETAFTADPSDPAHMVRLVEALAGRGGVPAQIAYLWPADGEAAASDDEGRAFYGLLHLAQALAEAEAGAVRLMIATRGLQRVADADAPQHPEAALSLGPAAVIPRELPHIATRHVDLDAAASAEDAAAALLREAASGASGGASAFQPVAYRDGERWALSYEPSALSEQPAAPRVADGHAVLITGGLSGLGLTMARRLADRAAVRLVLTGRTPLPPRDEWDAYLLTHGAEDKAARAVQAVRDLEARGAEVMTAAADVCDAAQMASVVVAAQERFGPIRGAIHAAGTLDDAPILAKSDDEAAAVLAPKVLGTLVLDRALQGAPLDFMALFSSTSALLGLPGQVDYAAANAFLNAFAAHKQAAGVPCLAIDWGMWQGVGMAARAAGQAPPALDETPTDRSALDHPLFSHRLRYASGADVFVAPLSAETHWALAEHRLAGGEIVAPGTLYLDVAHAAFEAATGSAAASLRDVYFLRPLRVGEAETCDVRVRLEPEDDGFAFTIASVRGGHATEHAVGHLRADRAAQEAAPLDLLALQATCDQRTLRTPETTALHQAALRFGPRWNNVAEAHFGTDAALARLTADETGGEDATQHALHPALLDMATSLGLGLLGDEARDQDLYVPWSYKAVHVGGPLPDEVFSYARRRGGDGSQETAVFDVTITDGAGQPLVIVEEYVMRRVAATALAQSSGDHAPHAAGDVDVQPTASAEASSPGTASPDAARPLAGALAQAIRPSEGADAFERLLHGDWPAQIVVSPLDVRALMQQAAGSGRAGGDGRAADEASASEHGAFVAPRDDIETSLADLWRALLGAETVSIHDNFFDLGGHSLVAVRLFAKIRKQHGVDLSLASLFQAPTIAECAALIREELGRTPLEATGDGAALDAPALAGAARSRARQAAPSQRAAGSSWSPLVPIQPKGGRQPFFCVHGAGGNVLNFRDLSVRLGDDQPFYALQARGAEGHLEPHRRIEEMAAAYVDAVRAVQPHGPYLLGGYSGGGVIAFEMAHQLHAAGEDVGRLIFLDTFCPRPSTEEETPRSTRSLRERVEEHADGLKSDGWTHVADWLRGRWMHERSRLKVLAAKVADVVTARTDIALPDSMLRLQMMHRLVLNYHRATEAYDLKPYPGRAHLFRAAKRVGGEKQPDDILGWGGLLGEGVVVHEVPGNHDNLLQEPNVRVLTEKLRAQLDAAQPSAAPPPAPRSISFPVSNAS